MRMEELIGTFAGFFTTVAALPQIYKAWRSKKVDDVSPKMFYIITIGVFLWTIYGILKADVPIIVTNGISVVLNCTMLVLIYRYRTVFNG
ncbi:MtN3 and saliva related transmembrane protein [Maribacter sedimenticola]|uniref:MtN3 and saliva related transmembrane protein n=2 Tax=Flavobacteriaceae TaxID=49546 RepID=A0ABY1SL92_9FLAO|nr:MtN3 and saliva related transmembrane protein [Maribacter sp. MAR_2009_72]SNR74690.1 MtN3 and saliva related transmembrane protein [Maribacter sedimenticola]